MKTEMMEVFRENVEAYIQETGDTHPCKYECMECGTTFYGKWHSNYSMYKVKCPVCEDDTDPLFIKIMG